MPGFSSASPWPTLELEWGRKLYPTTGPRGAGGLMFGLPPTGGDLNQPRGPVTSLKEEPLGARAWMQPADQTKYVKIFFIIFSLFIVNKFTVMASFLWQKK